MAVDGLSSELPDQGAFLARLSAELRSAGSRSGAGQSVAGQRAATPALITIKVLSLRVRSFGSQRSQIDAESRTQMIKTLTRRLRDLVRPSEYLALTGKDQFSILVQEPSSVVDVESRVLRILEVLHSSIDFGSDSMLARCSAGIALMPEEAGEPEALFRNSEAALRIADEQDASYRFWYDGLGVPFSEKRALERDLAEAIEADQLELHFQPLVDGETREILGMEALARWRRPGYGWIPPLAFFSVAKEAGLLEQLEEWVLRRAASIHSTWRKRGISRGRLSINCVPSFLARSSFAPMVLSNLALQDLDGEAVEFEVVEESFRPGASIQVESLISLRESGMRVAIDDFRWGHLDEQSLAELPVDRLKIAPTCLPGAGDPSLSPVDGSAALSIIRVAQKLNLDVSAEGVETEAQRNFLLDHGCRVMQGFLFSKPVTPLDAAVLLRRGQIDI